MILLSLLLVHPVQTLMKCELNAEVESFHDQICNWYNWQAWIIALFFSPTILGVFGISALLKPRYHTMIISK